MTYDRQTSNKEKSAVPSYGPGNSLYSTTESLTAQDIENYFRIVPNRENSSINSIDNSITNKTESKTVQYLRPTTFEQQQKEVQRLNKNKIDIIPYATFHEKYLSLYSKLKLHYFFLEKNYYKLTRKLMLVISNKDMIMNFYR